MVVLGGVVGEPMTLTINFNGSPGAVVHDAGIGGGLCTDFLNR